MKKKTELVEEMTYTSNERDKGHIPLLFLKLNITWRSWTLNQNYNQIKLYQNTTNEERDSPI